MVNYTFRLLPNLGSQNETAAKDVYVLATEE